MDGMMKEKDRMWNEFVELLERYNDGSFARMVCDYIRLTGMTEQEVENMLQQVRNEKGA
jgi:dGTP triphosphohydrolase